MMKQKLILIFFFLSVFIHVFYYYSSFVGDHLNLFFENVTMGQDFFQVPNAAYSVLRGGDLQGKLPEFIAPYTDCCAINSNVYHPFFTLVVGIPLQMLPPWNSFYAWVLAHLAVTCLLLYIFWKNFKHEKILPIALSFYLLNSYHFYEIKHAQYHFLVSFFTIILILELYKNKDSIAGGVYYFLSLIVKPIGLLWSFPLLVNEKFKTFFLGIFLFTAASVPFIFWEGGRYYFDNFLNVSSSSFANYNLLAISRFIEPPHNLFPALAGFVFVFLILWQIIIKPNIFQSFFVWVSFQLLFYSLVFHYHFSILAGFIALGFLLKIFKLRGIEMIPIILLTIPSPVIFYRLAGDPPILPERHLALVALWSVFWLIFLMLIIIYRSIKNKNYESY